MQKLARILVKEAIHGNNGLVHPLGSLHPTRILFRGVNLVVPSSLRRSLRWKFRTTTQEFNSTKILLLLYMMIFASCDGQIMIMLLI